MRPASRPTALLRRPLHRPTRTSSPLQGLLQVLLTSVFVIPIQFLSGGITPVKAMPAWQAHLTLRSPNGTT